MWREFEIARPPILDFDGCERAVQVRIAEHAGRIYLDLGDELWRAA